MKKLENISIQDLVAGLTYVENLALAYKNVTGHINSLTKQNVLTESECLVELQKLAKGFSMADEVSFQIEAELDARMKSNFGLHYGTKTLSAIQETIDKKVEDRNAEKEEKNKPEVKMNLT